MGTEAESQGQALIFDALNSAFADKPSRDSALELQDKLNADPLLIGISYIVSLHAVQRLAQLERDMGIMFGTSDIASIKLL